MSVVKKESANKTFSIMMHLTQKYTTYLAFKRKTKMQSVPSWRDLTNGRIVSRDVQFVSEGNPSLQLLNDFDFLPEFSEQTLNRNRDTEKQKTFLPFHSMWPNLPFLILRRNRGKEHFSLPSFPTNYTTLAILYCSISV